MQPTNQGTIFNIQRFSIHDGPGIRTTVFFKGCNLRCFWCHNPEAAAIQPQLQYFPEKCIVCGNCAAVCPEGAHRVVDGGRLFQRDLCRLSFRCVEECFSGALQKIGKDYTVPELVAEIERDQPYFESSGGGVTFSGGEPLLQKDFLKALLQICRARGIHTAVDTAGNLPQAVFEEIQPLTDLFLYDIKACDEDIHRQATGVGNRRIHANLRWLAQAGSQVWVRIPVIPGVNDSQAEIQGIARLLAPLTGIQWVELMAFHTLGSEKYASLGQGYPAAGITPPSKERMAQIQAVLAEHGLNARIMN